MADHDLFIKHNAETGQFEPKRLRATFYDRGTLRVKFDDTEQYWRDFVGRWWHHDGLSFAPVELTAEQQARLDEVNLNAVTADRLSEVANYVQFGAVDADTTEPYLASIASNAAVVEATLEHRRDELRTQLASHRYGVEISGTQLADGTPVLTGRSDQAQLTSVHQTLKEGFQTQINWKGPTGWAVVTLTEISPIAQAASDHVQKAFTAEKQVDDLISAAATIADLTDFDVTTEYDAAFAVL